jgi:predicted RNase H-like nuclease
MIGIDGTKEGWITAEYKENTWKINFCETLSEINNVEALIDIPIGLPESSTRKCDSMARTLLAPERHYSVFNCPVREAVYAESYEEACSKNESMNGKKISKQAWNLTPKIKEADKETRRGKELKESHPEVFFKKLDKNAVKYSKNCEKGLKGRKKVLSKYGDIPALERFQEKNITDDDILDAMVLALGDIFKLETIPRNPPTDEKEVNMCIHKPVID